MAYLGLRVYMLIGIMTVSLSAPAFGGKLDASGGSGSSTLRTELHRGASAADGCAGTDNNVLADCIYAAHTREVQQKTATKAYMTGLFFGGWLRAASNPDIKKTHTAEGVARDFFFYLEQHRNDLGLSLTEVCEGTRHSCDQVEPLWRDWEERMNKARH